MKLFLIPVLFFLCSCNLIFGQDIHFTQFYAAPLTLNPAFTGNYSGDYRFMNTYRSQWGKFNPGYITNAFGYDRQFYLYNEKISGGLNIVYDKSGINALKVTKINLSAAYHRIISKNSLHGGLQVGYILKSFDVARLSFPDQFNHETGYFDNSLPTYDANLNDNTSWLDFNAGISWNRKFGKHTPEIGFALFHINHPNDRFFKKSNKLPSRNVITVSNKWELNDKFYVTPHVMYMEQVQANDFMYGAIFTKKNNNPESKIKSVSAGLLSRNSFNSSSDAISIVGGFKYNLFDFGLSYDLNISDLKVATDKQGAFEISIIYTALNTRVLKVKIPCERY